MLAEQSSVSEGYLNEQKPHSQSGEALPANAEQPTAENRPLTPEEIHAEADAALAKAEQLLGLAEGSLATRTKESYLKNLKWGWIDRVLRYKGPQTEVRLAQMEGESFAAEKAHVTDFCDHPFDAGSSSSWTLRLREKMAKMWQMLREATKQDIANANSGEKLIEALEWTRESIEGESNNSFDQYAQALGITREQLFVTGSGASGILLVRKLLGVDVGFGTSNENGGEVVASLDTDKKPIALRKDPKAGESGETNKSRSQEEVAQDYISLIKGGDRIISFTVCSKTGLRYDKTPDNSPSALDIMMEYIAEHNAANREDIVVVVADAVQMAGREPISNLKEVLSDQRFIGMVHTVSKAGGGVPHTGFLSLNDRGRQIIEHNGLELSEKDLIEDQVIAAPERYGTSGDLLAQLRAIDNVEALSEAEEVLNHPDYARVVAELRQIYVSIFEKQGFKLLHNDTPTIIPFEPPISIPTQAVDKIFLTELARKGINMGGLVKEGNIPILRVGISIDLIKMVLFKDTLGDQGLALDSKKMKMLQESYAARLSQAVEKASGK